MAEAGALVILREPSVAAFGVTFSAPDLAAKVYQAMVLHRDNAAPNRS
jgi:hypothetical protein